jgi:hypothetical protein
MFLRFNASSLLLVSGLKNPSSTSNKYCRKRIVVVGFQVLTAASTKMTVFWVVAPCSPVEVVPTSQMCFLSPSSGRSIIVLMMEAVYTSETSAHFYQTTWRNNPEDSHLRE